MHLISKSGYERDTVADRLGIRSCLATTELSNRLTIFLDHSAPIFVESLGVFSEYHAFVLIVGYPSVREFY